MNAVAFDTHALVKRLTAVGILEAQAEVIVDEQVRLIDERLASVGTREDISKLGAATQENVARVEATTKTEVAQLETAMKVDIARLEAASKAEIARLETKMKADLARMEAATEAQIARLDAATKTAVAESKVYTLKWGISGVMGFQTIVILGAVFAMVHFFVH